MSSTAADVHPALPPIRTTPRAPEGPACSSVVASSSSTAPAPDAESVATLPSAAEKKKKQQEEGEGEADSEAQQESEPTTPTSEGSKLRPPTECPPAPRKPAWAPPSTPAAKRKFQSSAAPASSARRARAFFFPVARDLTTVFLALPPAPPKKRIRAG